MDYSYLDSPFGRLLVASTENGLSDLHFAEDPDYAFGRLVKRNPKAELKERVTAFHEAAARYLNGQSEELPTLDLRGTPFQKAVWDELLKIPRGQTRTYGQLAAAIQNPKACRAVGSAVGDNPIAILVPCHRVLPSTGKVGNYFWGPEIKTQLLKSEGVL